MRLDIFISSVLIAILFLTGGILIINEQSAAYGVPIDAGLFENISEEINATLAITQDQKQDILGQSVSEDFAFDNIITGGFIAVGKVFSYLKITGTVVTLVAKSIGIPAFAVNIFMAVLLIFVIFSIIYTFVRFMPR